MVYNIISAFCYHVLKVDFLKLPDNASTMESALIEPLAVGLYMYK